MIIGESLPFIRDYVSAVNESIKQDNPSHQLTRLQSYWLGFVILGLLVTNSFCWARYERFGLGRVLLKKLYLAKIRKNYLINTRIKFLNCLHYDHRSNICAKLICNVCRKFVVNFINYLNIVM